MHPDVAAAFDRMTAAARRDVITVVINSRHMEAEVIGWFQPAGLERIEAIEEPKGIVPAHQPPSRAGAASLDTRSASWHGRGVAPGSSEPTRLQAARPVRAWAISATRC